MEQRGWGPGELAEQSGVAYDTIYKVRSTQRPRTSAEVVAKLAVALGCSMDYLMGLTDAPVPTASEEMSTVMLHLCLVAHALPEGRQRDLLRIAEALQEATQEDAVEQLHVQMMELVMEEVHRIGGDAGLHALMDRLESAFPGEVPSHPGRARLDGSVDDLPS